MDKISIDDIIKKAKEIENNKDSSLTYKEAELNDSSKISKDDLESGVKISATEDIKEFSLNKSKYSKQDRGKTAVIPSLKANATDKTVKVDFKTSNIKKSKQERTMKVDRIDKTRVITSNDNVPTDNEVDDRTRPVIISTNSVKDDKTDLNTVPTIFSVNKLDDAFKYHSESNDLDEELGVQMTFEGFDDEIETVSRIDEQAAERVLKKNREDKINKFRLFGPDETDKKLNEEKVVDNDYINEADKANVLESLSYTNSKTKSKIIVTFILSLLLIFITAFKDKGFFPAFLSEHLAYFTTSLIIYIGVLITNFNIIIHAFKFKNGINFDFVTMITAISVLIHNVLLTLNENLWYDNGVLLTSIASFALLMSQLGKYLKLNQIIDNFKYLTSEEEKHTIENITNEIDAKIISRGIIDEEAVIKTSVKTDFPTNFLDISCKTEPADKISNPLSFIMLGLSLILFIAIGIKDNFNTGFNTFICSICATNPIIALYATNKSLKDITKSSAKNGARLCGYEGAQITNNSNVMVMEAADFFDKSCCDKHGIKVFNNAKIDDAILYTAAVMIKSKSPLSHVFDDVIIGKKSILPEVEDIVYENKMGTSAWIYGQKVLVGNRDLLIAHAVAVPKIEFEQKYTQKDKHALYLAVNGTICAMFIFGYSANPVLKQELKKLEKSGITIIVRSCDPYINEQELCRIFNLPNDFIKVMNSSAARIYEKYSNMTVEKSPAYVIHNGTALSFVSAMKSAEDLMASKKLIKFLCSFGSALGFIIISFLSLTNEYSQITAMGCLMFHIIWSVFVVFTTKLNKLLF